MNQATGEFTSGQGYQRRQFFLFLVFTELEPEILST